MALGLTDGEQMEVREGLAQGESVVRSVPVPDGSPTDSSVRGERAERVARLVLAAASRDSCPGGDVLAILTGVDVRVSAGERPTAVRGVGPGESNLRHCLAPPSRHTSQCSPGNRV